MAYAGKDAIVIFDTNFLIIPSKYKVDIFAGVDALFIGRNARCAVFDKSLDELQKIASSRKKDSQHARAGLALVSAKGIEVIRSGREGSYADNLLAAPRKYLEGFDGEIYIATMDAELRRRVKESGNYSISLRKKRQLEIV